MCRPPRRENRSLSVLQAVVLGLTQGLTEFAPVSSSGHLILVPWLFHWSIVNDPALNKTFDVALHIGTLAGALAYFRRDVARYLRAFGRSIVSRPPASRSCWRCRSSREPECSRASTSRTLGSRGTDPSSCGGSSPPP